MAKKSFLNDNPAMAYITPQTEATQNTPDTDITEHIYNTEQIQITQHTHVTNKRKQTKSARVQILMVPALHKELTIIALIGSKNGKKMTSPKGLVRIG